MIKADTLKNIGNAVLNVGFKDAGISKDFEKELNKYLEEHKDDKEYWKKDIREDLSEVMFDKRKNMKRRQKLLINMLAPYIKNGMKQ